MNVLVFPLWSLNKKSELPEKLEILGNFEIPVVLCYNLYKLGNRGKTKALDLHYFGVIQLISCKYYFNFQQFSVVMIFFGNLNGQRWEFKFDCSGGYYPQEHTKQFLACLRLANMDHEIII